MHCTIHVIFADCRMLDKRRDWYMRYHMEAIYITFGERIDFSV